MSHHHEHVYQIIVQQFSQNLHSLTTLLNKATAHAETLKYDPNKFLDMKLAPDMFTFIKQVQMTTDTAKGAVARLSGKENPVYPDDEKTFPELIARVQKTIHFLESFKKDDFNAYESKTVSFPWYPGKHLEGKTYLHSFVIPNFYFHLTTAYNLLRNAGVAIGKSDFLGNVDWKND